MEKLVIHGGKPLRGTVRVSGAKNAVLPIIAASIVMLLSQLTMQNMSGYVYPDYYNNAAAQSASTLMMMVGMLLAAALVKPIAKRIGKTEVSVISSLFAAAVNVICSEA